MKPRARRHRHAARRGASLVLFVILVFALMAVAALTVDISSAQLTQTLMQDAVDTSALEGHRWRDFKDGFATQPDDRRYRASHLVREVFDDDFDPTNGDALNLGAGPVLDTDSAATGGLSVGAPPVYDPNLRFNRFNLQYGDFVSGDYDPSQPHGEAFDYTRADLTPAEAGQREILAEAFLARMRRTDVHNDDDDIPSKSSKGPGMPLLFGHGSTVHGSASGSYDPRRDGLTVRATAIALSQPALSVGITPHGPTGARIEQSWDIPPHQSREHIGVARFALHDTYWSTIPITETPLLKYDAPTSAQPVGRLRTYDAATGTMGDVVGFFVVDLVQVGREVVHTTTVPPAIELTGFVPVYRIIDGVKRVVGFGHARLVSYTAANVWALGKLDSHLPMTGSSASLTWPVDPLTDTVWSEILRTNRELFSNELETASVLAPGIAR